MKAVALANIDCILVAPAAKIQKLMVAMPPLLKFAAASNVDWKLVTLLTFQEPMFWLNADALENIAEILVTLPVFQLPIGRLNEVAKLNIKRMLVTAAVFQELMVGLPPLLKFAAPSNMDWKLVHLLTFHEPMSWLNADAPKNIVEILVTLLVFQLPIGWLKAGAEENVCVMLVTAAVFQELILEGPFKVVQLLNILTMLVHVVKTGMSVAVMFKLLQP